MSVLASYPNGTRPSVTGTFEDTAGVVSAATVKTRSPSGDVQTYDFPADAEIVEDADNVLTFTFPGPLTERGTWKVEFKGTAGVIAANEGGITIEKSSFP